MRLDEVGRHQAHSLRIDEARRRRLRPWAIAGAATVVLVCGSIILTYTPMLGARVVEVEGEDRLSPRYLMRLAGVAVGTNVVHLDASAVEARLEGDPWVLDATVGTNLPGTITIAVRERVPALVLTSPEGRRLVAVDGTDLGRAPRAVPLPTVVAGEGATLDRASIALAGEAVLAMVPELRARVDEVAISADEGLVVTVDGDVEVRFGDAAGAVAKAQALRAILAYAEDEGETLVSVDVSVPAASTARFAGSQQPVSMPDPSADRASADDEPDGGSAADAGTDVGDGDPASDA